MKRSYNLETKHDNLLGFYLFGINVLLGQTFWPYFVIDMGRASHVQYISCYIPVPSVTESWYFNELIY